MCIRDRDGTIATADLADNAVNSAKIGADVIVADDVANNAITTAQIANDAVTAAKIADSVALGAGYLTQLASSTDILIILLGILLLFVEAVAIPGFGIFGITGIIILFYGFYLLLIPDIPVSPEVYSEALDGFSWAIVVGIFGIIFILRLIGKSAFFQKLVSSDTNKTTLKKNFKNRSKVE